MLLQCALLATFLYPVAPQNPVVDSYYGYDVIDPYQWLEDEEDPEVQKWEKEQQDLSEAELYASCNPLPIYHRLKELMSVSENRSFTVGKSSKVVTVFQDKEDDQPIYYIQDHPDAPLEVLLNPNKWGVGYEINELVFAPNTKILAYAYTTKGDENSIITLMDLKTKQIIEEPLCGWIQKNIVWRSDSKGFYYIAFPKEGDKYFWPTLYFHKLGTDCSEDKVIFHDPKEKYWQLFLMPETTTTMTLHCFRWNEAGEEEMVGYSIDLQKLSPTLTKSYSRSTNQPHRRQVTIGETTYLITNSKAPNFKVTALKLAGKGRTIIPESDGIITDICGIGGKLAVTYLREAHTKISIFTRQGKYLYDIPLPKNGVATLNPNWEEPETHLIFSSLTTPPTSYTYNVENNKLELHLDPYEKEQIFSDLETHLVHFTSKDGTPLTMFLAHKKGIALKGKNPVLLRGYGGFGTPTLPYFRKYLIPWLEAGGVVAIPNIRGGGEYGEKWHQMGKRELKQNTFDDFIAAAEWLIDYDYTRPENLSIEGSSNGGLLIGACLTQRPDLFKAALCQHPLLDMLRYHLFRMGALWKGEFCSSETPEGFQTLYCYSPYHHIEEGVPYPAVLFSGGKQDARVDNMHIRKMCARLQEASSSESPILMFLDPNSGHHCPSNELFMRALSKNHGFLMDQLGMRARLPDSVNWKMAERKLHLKEEAPPNKIVQGRGNTQTHLRNIEKQTIYYELLKKYNFQWEIDEK